MEKPTWTVFAGDKGWTITAFMGQLLQLYRYFTILFGYLVGSNILRRVSWFTAAVITPLIIGLGGVLFFHLLLPEDVVQFILHALSKMLLLLPHS